MVMVMLLPPGRLDFIHQSFFTLSLINAQNARDFMMNHNVRLFVLLIAAFPIPSTLKQKSSFLQGKSIWMAWAGNIFSLLNPDIVGVFHFKYLLICELKPFFFNLPK